MRATSRSWGLSPYITGADPQYPVQMDITRTLLAPGLFAKQTGPGVTEGYGKYDLLHKVYNQFTTRSNCFAVYAVVGYFEVRNPGPYSAANPTILGKEVGSDDPSIGLERHRFFALVDRTNLAYDKNSVASPSGPKQAVPPVYFSYQPQTDIYAANPDPAVNPTVTLCIPATGVDNPANPTTLYGNYDGRPFAIKAGVSQFSIDVVAADPGAAAQGYSRVVQTQEDNVIAVVPSMTPSITYDPTTGTGTFQVKIAAKHARGCAVRLCNPDPTMAAGEYAVPGNPGPQPNFSFRSARYRPVVPLVQRID